MISTAYEYLKYNDFELILHRGCDDLLPILSYVIIKAGNPLILSESTVMEELIDER